MCGNYVGKIRIICSKINNENIEVYEYDIFEDQLITDVEECADRECIREHVNGVGVEDGFSEDIKDILKNYSEGDVAEIVADVYFEDMSGMTDCGMEYDYNAYLKNEKHRKLTKEQIERFVVIEEENDER